MYNILQRITSLDLQKQIALQSSQGLLLLLAVIFKTCMWKHILVIFSSIFRFSLSKYSTLFVDSNNILPRKAYTSCIFDSFVVGTPYGQRELFVPPSTLYAPLTTSLTSSRNASLLRFKHSPMLDLNFSNSLRLNFSFIVVAVAAT